MTGQQIYELASSFLYEIDGEDEDSKRFAVGFINILLQECLNCENSMRLSGGKKRWTKRRTSNRLPRRYRISRSLPALPSRMAWPRGFSRKRSTISKPRITAASTCPLLTRQVNSTAA